MLEKQKRWDSHSQSEQPKPSTRIWALLESAAAILHSRLVSIVLATAIGTTPGCVVSQSMCHLFLFSLARCLATLDLIPLLAEPTYA
ncbi:MAG: hypothetical protein ABSB29_07610 [Nitrososphaerales archaeon]